MFSLSRSSSLHSLNRSSTSYESIEGYSGDVSLHQIASHFTSTCFILREVQRRLRRHGLPRPSHRHARAPCPPCQTRRAEYPHTRSAPDCLPAPSTERACEPSEGLRLQRCGCSPPV